MLHFLIPTKLYYSFQYPSLHHSCYNEVFCPYYGPIGVVAKTHQVALKRARHEHLITWTLTLPRVHPDPGDGFMLRLLARCFSFDILLSPIFCNLVTLILN